MAYYPDVSYVDDSGPELVERNGAEFLRMRDLIDSVEPAAVRARFQTVWDSLASENFDLRMAEVYGLVHHMSSGFDHAGRALQRYADRLSLAKAEVSAGRDAERRLDELVSAVAVAVTRTAEFAEPMRRWEDLRGAAASWTGWQSWGWASRRFRDRASQWYGCAYQAYDRALTIEEPARADCLAELRVAYEPA